MTVMYPFFIPENELRIETARASGPGGQNVNKVESRVQLRWLVADSAAFSQKQKDVICKKLANRINKAGELMVDVESERSQSQNKQTAQDLLHKLVAQALKPEKRRKATKPTRASKERRLLAKKRTGQQKQLRKKVIRD